MALRRYFMHLSKQNYEELGDGLVRVIDSSGKSGIFRWDGLWVEGDLRQANSNMLAYCGGPTVPEGFDYRWTEVPADVGRSSGWPEELERQLRQNKLL